MLRTGDAPGERISRALDGTDQPALLRACRSARGGCRWIRRTGRRARRPDQRGHDIAQWLLTTRRRIARRLQPAGNAERVDLPRQALRIGQWASLQSRQVYLAPASTSASLKSGTTVPPTGGVAPFWTVCMASGSVSSFGTANVVDPPPIGGIGGSGGNQNANWSFAKKLNELIVSIPTLVRP